MTKKRKIIIGSVVAGLGIIGAGIIANFATEARAAVKPSVTENFSNRLAMTNFFAKPQNEVKKPTVSVSNAFDILNNVDLGNLSNSELDAINNQIKTQEATLFATKSPEVRHFLNKQREKFIKELKTTKDKTHFLGRFLKQENISTDWVKYNLHEARNTKIEQQLKLKQSLKELWGEINKENASKVNSYWGMNFHYVWLATCYINELVKLRDNLDTTRINSEYNNMINQAIQEIKGKISWIEVYYHKGWNVASLYKELVSAINHLAEIMKIGNIYTAQAAPSSIWEYQVQTQLATLKAQNPQKDILWFGYSQTYINAVQSFLATLQKARNELNTDNNMSQYNGFISQVISTIKNKINWIHKYRALNWDATAPYNEMVAAVKNLETLASIGSLCTAKVHSEAGFLKYALKAQKEQLSKMNPYAQMNPFGYNYEYFTLGVQFVKNWIQERALLGFNKEDNKFNKMFNDLSKTLLSKAHWVNVYYQRSWNAFAVYKEFVTTLNKLVKLQGTEESSYKKALEQMQEAKAQVARFNAESKGIAIASTVATVAGIALAAGYWAASWFFGITVADAISATVGAAATTVATGTMWAAYAESNELYKKIEGGITNWLYYANDLRAFYYLRYTWGTFKKLFTSTFPQMLMMAKTEVTIVDLAVEACAWANPVLGALGTLLTAFGVSIFIANVVINAVNHSLINLVY